MHRFLLRPALCCRAAALRRSTMKSQKRKKRRGMRSPHSQVAACPAQKYSAAMLALWRRLQRQPRRAPEACLMWMLCGRMMGACGRQRRMFWR
jgi:hypothetical protein